MRHEISAGLVIYRSTPLGPRFLLLYHGGRYWNFPKGRIEFEDDLAASSEKVASPPTPGPRRREMSIEAAIRETAEETGLQRHQLELKRGFKVYEKFRFFKNKEAVFKTVILYLAETKESAVQLTSAHAAEEGYERHEGYGWFLYKDAKFVLRSYKDTLSILGKAFDFIESGRPQRAAPPGRRRVHARRAPQAPSGQAPVPPSSPHP